MEYTHPTQVTVPIDRSILPPDLLEAPLALAARTPDWIQHNRIQYDRLAAAQIRARDAWAALGTVMHEPPIHWPITDVARAYPERRAVLIKAFNAAMDEYQKLIADYPGSYERMCAEREAAADANAKVREDARNATLRRSPRLKSKPDYKGDLRADLLGRIDLLEGDLKAAEDRWSQFRDQWIALLAEDDRLRALYVTAWAPYAISVTNFHAQELWKKVKAGEPDEAIDQHRALKKALKEAAAAISAHRAVMNPVGRAFDAHGRRVSKITNKINRLRVRIQHI